MRSEGLFDSPGESIPHMPDLLGDLMAIKPNMPPRRVVRMFKHEPGLSESLRLLAEAPYYTGRRPMEGLGRILERVGLAGMRGLAMRVVLDEVVFTGDHPLHEPIRRHATATAYIITVLSRYTPLPTERLFTAALLQNVGLAIPLNNGLDGDGDDDVWQALRYAHEGISCLAAAEWDLSDEIQHIVGHHHQLGRGLSADRDIAALVAADHIAHNMRLSIDHPSHPAPDEASLGLALDILELHQSQLPSVQAESSELLRLLA